MDEWTTRREEGSQTAVAEVSGPAGAELGRGRWWSPFSPQGAPTAAATRFPHEEAVLPGERTGNPAPRQSPGSASPPPAQPQWPDPSHLVSKYTLGGCQESGGIAAIAQPAESCSKATSGVGSWGPSAAAHTSGLRRSTFAMSRFGGLRRGRRRTPLPRPRSWDARREKAGCKDGEKCKLHCRGSLQVRRRRHSPDALIGWFRHGRREQPANLHSDWS